MPQFTLFPTPNPSPPTSTPAPKSARRFILQLHNPLPPYYGRRKRPNSDRDSPLPQSPQSPPPPQSPQSPQYPRSDDAQLRAQGALLKNNKQAKLEANTPELPPGAQHHAGHKTFHSLTSLSSLRAMTPTRTPPPPPVRADMPPPSPPILTSRTTPSPGTPGTPATPATPARPLPPTPRERALPGPLGLAGPDNDACSCSICKRAEASRTSMTRKSMNLSSTNSDSDRRSRASLTSEDSVTTP